ncbi:LysR family transcriptional regulator, partial [Pseudomonas sp. CAN2814]|uniref:helix-turn-helix domain-containing protein n=1 Tax=Pseudomonas sp. CAN1 TaxID=3046726 RepID=UPI002647FDE4
MDRLQAMQVYTRIVELKAFGKAADSLQLPRASVTQLIQQLETHLGVQLLRRTTRQVSVSTSRPALASSTRRSSTSARRPPSPAAGRP